MSLKRMYSQSDAMRALGVFRSLPSMRVDANDRCRYPCVVLISANTNRSGTRYRCLLLVPVSISGGAVLLFVYASWQIIRPFDLWLNIFQLFIRWH